MDGRLAALVVMALLVPALLVVSLGVGYVQINPCEVVLALLGQGGVPATQRAIIWNIRLPRALMAIVAGFSLAMAGIALQGVLKNPLVSPFTLGISSGASFGAALAIVLGVGVTGVEAYMVMANAFVFSLVAVAMTLAVARLRGMTRESVILAGIAMMYLFSALVTLLQYVAQEWELRILVYWIMGDLAVASWRRLTLMLPSIAVASALLLYAWDLNVLSMGDEIALSSGTNPRTARISCTVLASLATAIVVCMTGPIGFIGLVSPHMARLIVGADHRFSMVASALLGAIILLASDTLSRVVIAPVELPVGVVTAFMGVPLFLHLLLRSRREMWA